MKKKINGAIMLATLCYAAILCACIPHEHALPKVGYTTKPIVKR